MAWRSASSGGETSPVSASSPPTVSRPPYTASCVATSQAAARVQRPGRSSPITPVARVASTATATLTTAQPTRATTASAPRSRPQRSVLPPIVSSSTPPPTAQNTLSRRTRASTTDIHRATAPTTPGRRSVCSSAPPSPSGRARPTTGAVARRAWAPACPGARRMRRRPGCAQATDWHRRRNPATTPSSCSLSHSGSRSTGTHCTASTSRFGRNVPEPRCIAQKRTSLLRPLRSR